MVKPRDYQKSKVYAFDREAEYEEYGSVFPQYSYDECVAFVKRVLDDYNEPMVKVKDGRRTRIARGGKDLVNLPRWSRNPVIMLHELAHVLTIRWLGDNQIAHGPEYVGIYVTLLQKYTKLSEAWLYTEIGKRGITIDTAWLTSRKAA